MNNFKNYIVEREGGELLEYNYGFTHYVTMENEIFISDMYVDKDFRRKGKPTEMLNKLIIMAKEFGKNYITCQCDLGQNNPEMALRNILNHGFKIAGYENQIIKFYLGVNNG